MRESAGRRAGVGMFSRGNPFPISDVGVKLKMEKAEAWGEVRVETSHRFTRQQEQFPFVSVDWLSELRMGENGAGSTED